MRRCPERSNRREEVVAVDAAEVELEGTVEEEEEGGWVHASLECSGCWSGKYRARGSAVLDVLLWANGFWGDAGDDEDLGAWGGASKRTVLPVAWAGAVSWLEGAAGSAGSVYIHQARHNSCA